jgi:hypothetical protein
MPDRTQKLCGGSLTGLGIDLNIAGTPSFRKMLRSLAAVLMVLGVTG